MLYTCQLVSCRFSVVKMLAHIFFSVIVWVAFAMYEFIHFYNLLDCIPTHKYLFGLGFQLFFFFFIFSSYSCRTWYISCHKDTTYTETEMSSFCWNFHHWLHWKLSKWQLPVQPVIKISSKWRHFRFSVNIAHDFACGCQAIWIQLLLCGYNRTLMYRSGWATSGIFTNWALRPLLLTEIAVVGHV